ncbi:hypothetical protein A8139_14985 [Marinomonas primoryensis]|uniref:Uncharacterized protein n=1 Tax=Marinomonas primoryensis TaxID=178399 RepID=A0A2Z4PUP8_9GAMM|nr:hypothetical protein [Marinomonas primoryensis]AWY01135.1 hypothetical protein A8139_14985 [Marinomonas primoryensis]
MIETVCKTNIKLKDVTFDKKLNAIVFSNISKSGNKSVDLIGNLVTLLAKVSNGKGSRIEERKKKAGFKLDARKFSVAALTDHIQINYDFSGSSPDLIQPVKEIVCDVLTLHFNGITKSVKQLNEVDQPVSDSYQASGFSKIQDAFEAIKTLYEIAEHQGVKEFDIQVEGSEEPHQIKILSPPEKPDFRPDVQEISFLEYEISDVHKKGPSIEIVPRSGKGKKFFLVNAEQYAALEEGKGFSIDIYVLYDFTVKQLSEKQYELISFSRSSVQMDIEH